MLSLILCSFYYDDLKALFEKEASEEKKKENKTFSLSPKKKERKGKILQQKAVHIYEKVLRTFYY